MKKFFFLSLAALLFLAVSCPQQDSPPKTPRPDELPPITQTGENTFGCLVNGKIWLPGGGGIPAVVPEYYKNDFFISAQKSLYNSAGQAIINQYILIDVKPVYDTGKYFIKSKNLYAGNGFADRVQGFEYTYNDNDSLKNWVHITKIDQSKLIISGTFNLFFRATGHDTLNVTAGRFDVKYSY